MRTSYLVALRGEGAMSSWRACVDVGGADPNAEGVSLGRGCGWMSRVGNLRVYRGTEDEKAGEVAITGLRHGGATSEARKLQRVGQQQEEAYGIL